MPYTAPHSLLTFGGPSFGGSELWACTLRMIGTTPPTQEELEAVGQAFRTLLQDSSLGFSNGFIFDMIKWAPQDINGRYGDDGEAVEHMLSNPLGGATGPGYPQTAFCVSWRTARARGYASNGRMYIPASPGLSSGTGRMSESTALTVATAAATFIGAVIDADIGIPAVMSTVGAGRTEAITGVRAGRVVDTQRRRRNQLEESYTAVVPVP